MNVLVIGNGGREHAIVKALKKSEQINSLYALPGNGGMEMQKDAICVSMAGSELDLVCDFCKNHAIDFVVVTPDDPLVAGMVDALNAAGISTFGPTKKAARIEGSKIFAKQLMQKYSIPTASYAAFDDPDKAKAYLLSQQRFPVVLKADGLALGKGVIIATTMQQGLDALAQLMVAKEFGESGSRIIIEEFLTGPEVSVLTFCDGKTILPMVSAMDHKRALDGNLGSNTGGMGTIAPNPYYNEEIARECMQTIFLPTMNAMNAEGCPFCGCLFFGLMLTPHGPKVIEYNCRFGDPETQVILPLLEGDLLTMMQAVSTQNLADVTVDFQKDLHAVCVVLASKGYPKQYQTGYEITGLSTAAKQDGVEIFHAGTKLQDGKLRTSGGRVLGVTAVGTSLVDAREKAYAAREAISFEGMHFRTDIGNVPADDK